MISKKKEYQIRTYAYGLWKTTCRDIENILGTEGFPGIQRILLKGQNEMCKTDEERRYFETCFFYGSKKNRTETEKFCASFWEENALAI